MSTKRLTVSVGRAYCEEVGCRHRESCVGASDRPYAEEYRLECLAREQADDAQSELHGAPRDLEGEAEELAYQQAEDETGFDPYDPNWLPPGWHWVGGPPVRD